MERSPRSAGVRPRTGASMGQHGQYHTLRSFVISLAIAILISKSPASGFTVARDILNSAPDLETGESKQLEVRYDLKTLNDDKAINNNKTREDSNSTVIAINNSNNYSDEEGNEQQRVVTQTDDTQTKVSGNNEIPFDGTIITTTDTDNSAFPTIAPSTSDYLSTIFSADTTFATDSEIEYAISNITPAKESQEHTTTALEHQNNTENISSIISAVSKSEDKMNRITTISDFESKLTTKTNISNQTHSKEASTIATTDGSLDTHTTVPSESNTVVTLDPASTEVTTQTLTDDMFTIDLFPPTLPPWKKYTTIDRKRTSTEDTTTDKDMTRAETAQTRLSLEKALNKTPIPSLEKLRNDLINSQGSTTKQLEVTTGVVSTSVSNSSDSVTNTSTTKMSMETETEPTKVELVSRRAGYKDNRETTSAKPSESTATEFSTTGAMNKTDMHETDVEVATNKTESAYGSQTQLAEDALAEELLKEEMINDNEENAKLWKQWRITGGVSEPVPEDMLSVKPIGMEKKKNTILYAVNPNYKPLKKIDVQPPKQFVRDPDDNSWRNESISSLGIVFKPKNASKSFTEVLKNKTEIELGNMTDKDSKDDLPDLRVRLEKIAEVRKSKKKINKFGDTVYSDYEESSENSNLSRENMATPIRADEESTFSSTPPPSPQSTSPITTAFDLVVNSISKEQFDLFKTEKASPITTNKPEKVYNLAEYYDTTDEYDVDYVNQYKIDLKKFTKALKPKEITTQPPEWLRTQPMREFQPERKATLQYFPPTTKVVQKVNVNDYDANFNRKVNLYDISKPKDILDVSFGTVSPIPTEKFEPLKKATVKPGYTPMYQTDNLDKNLYLSNQPSVSEPPPGALVVNDGNFNRASYVIKHYRDFINEAAKGGEDDRSSEYTYTEPTVHGVTVNELAKMAPRDSTQAEEDYEYDVKFRKDIMNRFVDNFNQNSERFKVDFPILYNSSVVHGETPEHGRVASSSAFMKRLYEVSNPRPSNFLRRSCEPNCYKTVELSPAYELHYYVPDEEEKEEVEPRSSRPPYRYRL